MDMELYNRIAALSSQRRKLFVLKLGFKVAEETTEKVLTAYYVTKKGQHLRDDSLRDYLVEKLPAYMLPNCFIRLDKIPRTANGKIDRKALPESGPDPAQEHVVPTDDVEKKLLEIWAKVLKIEKEMIGINDNFFELGGDSLKATLLTAEIHKKLAVKLPLLEIFKNTTIRKSSEIIKKVAGNRLISVESAEEKEYYPLSSAQRRVYFQEQMDTSNLSYHMFSVVELEGNLDRQKFQQTLTRLISRHDSLRTSFEIQDREPVQRVYKEVTFQVDYFEMKEEKAQQKLETLIQPFDISRPPLFKVGLIKVGAEKYLLMYNMHHIISDGISYSIFFREFMALYRGEPLPGLRLRYKDFSEWQRQRITAGEIENQERFWLNQFQTGAPPLRMPTDYPGIGPRNFKGDRLGFEINREISAKVKQLLVKTDTTLFMLLLAVYNVLLSTYTRQKDIVVGTPVSARTHPGLMPLIGMLVNMVALRNFPHQQKTFRAFLEEVKNNALDAFENQDYPFEELIMKLGIQGSAGGNPLFSTVFALDNINAPTPEIFESQLPGLKVKPRNYENKISHFDLVLHANETRDTLSLALEYSTELYKKSSARKLLERYVEILEQVVEDENIKIQDIKVSHGLLMSETNVPQDSDSNFGF